MRNMLRETAVLLVLPGAMCAAATVAAGETYRAVFTTIGEVSIRFA